MITKLIIVEDKVFKYRTFFLVFPCSRSHNVYGPSLNVSGSVFGMALELEGVC
jgi:hypothetical protein